MIDLLTNAPTEITLAGRCYEVAALRLRELGRLQRWVRDHSVRPTEAVKEDLENWPEAEHRRLNKEAFFAERDHWPPSIGGAIANRMLMMDPEGQRRFVDLMLRVHQPSLPPAEVNEVLRDLTIEDFGGLLAVAFGDYDLDPDSGRPRSPSPSRSSGPNYADFFHSLMVKPPHWDHQVIGELTLPQIMILASGGKMPRPNRKAFASSAQAEQWLATGGFC